MGRIYLDNAASTRIYDEVAGEMFTLGKEYYGNPSSSHAEGAKSAELIKKARRIIAECLNCDEGEVFFTSGGTLRAFRFAVRAGQKGSRRFGDRARRRAARRGKVL